MPALQVLELRVMDHINYGSTGILDRIHACVRNILESKVGRYKDGYFPKLTALVINPINYLLPE